jgi:hypothetical protein
MEAMGTGAATANTESAIDRAVRLAREPLLKRILELHRAIDALERELRKARKGDDGEDRTNG